jgi:hypothetical protein
MKTIVVVMAAVLMSGTCLASQSTAPPVTPKGVENSKRVMQLHKERYQRTKEVKKRAHARKQAKRATAAASAH